MTSAHLVTVRELRNRGGEVLERVRRGETVTITRDGEPMAELRAAPGARLSTAELIARRRHLPRVDPALLRAEIDAVIEQSW